jgi:hypothetical protein
MSEKLHGMPAMVADRIPGIATGKYHWWPYCPLFTIRLPAVYAFAKWN